MAEGTGFNAKAFFNKTVKAVAAVKQAVSGSPEEVTPATLAASPEVVPVKEAAKVVADHGVGTDSVKVVKTVVDGRPMTLAEKMQAIFDEAKVISEEKNRAYGSRNLSLTGEYGLAVRMMDKVSRLENLLYPGKNLTPSGDESVRDTALDLINYATYLVLMKDNKW
jgi:hypothetical protein